MFREERQQYQPSPYEQALSKEGLDWLNATSGKAPANVSQLPGMSPYIDIYNTATAKQQGQRYGLGSLRMGAEFANPNMLAALAQQDESHRRQDAGAQLEGAYRSRDAAVRGMAVPVINIGENRAQARLGAVGQQAGLNTNVWAQHQIRPGFWANMLTQTAQGAAAGAAAGV